MHHIHGASLAHERTNLLLIEQQEKALDPSYISSLKKEDSCFEDMIKKTDCIYCILSHVEPLDKEELLDYLCQFLTD